MGPGADGPASLARPMQAGGKRTSPTQAPAPTTPSRSTVERRRCPTRARPGSRTACTAGPAWSTTPPSPGPTRPGAACRSPAASSTSCTWARSRPRAPSTRRSSGSTTSSSWASTPSSCCRVNAFPGEQGWGYDGVDLFAVHEPYGGPEGLKRFVDAATPAASASSWTSSTTISGRPATTCPRSGRTSPTPHQTPWGAAVNLDAAGSDEVRAFFIDNALMWLRDYHCDGLRLDAVHALVDDARRPTSSRSSPATSTRSATELGRPLFLIAESDLNDPRLIRTPRSRRLGLTAQWSDDLHHALHATLTGETAGLLRRLRPASRRWPRR